MAVRSGSSSLRGDRKPSARPRVPCAVVTRARAGCHESFAEIYRFLHERVRRKAYRLIGDKDEADDAVQETFLAAYQCLHRLTDTTAFEGWLLQITHNMSVDRARRLARCRPSLRAYRESMDRAANLPRVLSRSGAQEVSPVAITLLNAELARLHPAVRETVLLRYRRGLTISAIMDLQGLTESCVKTRLFRSRRRLIAAFRAGAADLP